VVTPSVGAALAAFAERVRAMYGSRVRQIALFGSHARGEATPESDVDVVVVVDDLTGAEGRAVAHVAGDMLTEHDVLISAFTISTERMDLLRRRERLIAKEIDREGVAL
jgi:predicted nucleotidyltransferase